MSLRDLAETLSQAELRDLADAIEGNDVAATLEADLEDELADTSMGERQAAFDANPAIVDLLRAVGVEFRFPEEDTGGAPSPDEEPLIEEAEPPDTQPASQPTRRTRTPSGDGRPDPRMGDQRIRRRFPQPDIRSQFKTLESARRQIQADQGREIPPGEFYDDFAARIVSGALIITREEFVDAEQDPSATGTLA